MDNKSKIKYLKFGVVIGYVCVAIFVIYFLYSFIAGRVTAPLGSDEWYVQFEKSSQLKSNLPIAFIFMVIGSALIYFCQRPYQRLKSGIQGEARTQNVLENLPSNYTILSNIPIEYEGQRSEIDNLILSNKGIVIVETKNYKGNIQGNEDDREWKITKTSGKGNHYQDSIKNPIKQVKRQTYILSQILKQNQIHCWIDGYVFIHQVTCSVNSDVVFTHSGNLIQTILSSGKENALSEDDMERIKKVLVQ